MQRFQCGYSKWKTKPDLRGIEERENERERERERFSSAIDALLAQEERKEREERREERREREGLYFSSIFFVFLF